MPESSGSPLEIQEVKDGPEIPNQGFKEVIVAVARLGGQRVFAVTRLFTQDGPVFSVYGSGSAAVRLPRDYQPEASSVTNPDALESGRSFYMRLNGSDVIESEVELARAREANPYVQNYRSAYALIRRSVALAS